MSDISKRLRPESTDLSGSDVLVDILSRLPVKSLRRFQCASKSWHALISHSHFVKKHLSLINNTTNSFKLIFETRPLQSLDYQVLLKYLKEDYGAPIAPTELDYPVMTPNSSLLIFGSCNGLICLQFDKTNIVLWNPCTGESNLLPQATIFDGVHDCGSIFYGFGYDSKAEDYKVMRGGFKGEYGSDGYSWRLETIIEVFSLKNGSWRSTQVSDMDLAIEGQGCLVNETLHWVDDDNHAAIIISFDLVEEKFNEAVHCLCTIQTDSEIFFGGVLNIRNCVAVYSSNSEDLGILSDSGTSKKEDKIWMIKEYDVHDYWTEVATVISEGFFNPFCISEGGQVLGMLGGILGWYSPKENIFKNITEIRDRWSGATKYVETIVSPVTGNGAGIYIYIYMYVYNYLYMTPT